MNHDQTQNDAFLTKTAGRTVYQPRKSGKGGTHVKHIVPGAMKRAERKVRSTIQNAASVTNWDDEELSTGFRGYKQRVTIK